MGGIRRQPHRDPSPRDLGLVIGGIRRQPHRDPSPQISGWLSVAYADNPTEIPLRKSRVGYRWHTQTTPPRSLSANLGLVIGGIRRQPHRDPSPQNLGLVIGGIRRQPNRDPSPQNLGLVIGGIRGQPNRDPSPQISGWLSVAYADNPTEIPRRKSRVGYRWHTRTTQPRSLAANLGAIMGGIRGQSTRDPPPQISGWLWVVYADNPPEIPRHKSRVGYGWYTRTIHPRSPATNLGLVMGGIRGQSTRDPPPQISGWLWVAYADNSTEIPRHKSRVGYGWYTRTIHPRSLSANLGLVMGGIRRQPHRDPSPQISGWLWVAYADNPPENPGGRRGASGGAF